jgi:DtxR family Mn-dependent transcriptional regulator
MSQTLSPDAENYLKALYVSEQEGLRPHPKPPADRVAGELIRQKLVSQSDGSLTATKEGLRRAERVIRRHRLAERLLYDVIDIQEHRIVEKAACEFEHSLLSGVEEQVCTLLGHPTTCPHGRPIPPGRCCKMRARSANSVILPLSDLAAGEHGSIAYLSSKQADVVQKLMVMGVLPGAPVRVIQTFPSIAIQVGQTQMALDNSLARDVYIRRTPTE